MDKQEIMWTQRKIKGSRSEHYGMRNHIRIETIWREIETMWTQRKQNEHKGNIMDGMKTRLVEWKQQKTKIDQTWTKWKKY